MKCYLVIKLQVFFLLFFAQAEFQENDSPINDYDNWRSLNLNIKAINDKNKQQSLKADDGDPIIISHDEMLSPTKDPLLQQPPPQASVALGPITTERNEGPALLQTLWFTNQQQQWWSMQQKPPATAAAAEAGVASNAGSSNQIPSHYPSSAAAFKSINEHSRKLNKLKSSQINRGIFYEGEAKKEEEVGDGKEDKMFQSAMATADAGQSGDFLQSFEMYHRQHFGNDLMRSWTNVAVDETRTTTNNENANNNNNNGQQLEYLKFYNGNGLPPLSFGQLPQFQQNEQQQQQQQVQVLISPASLAGQLPQQQTTAFSASFGGDHHLHHLQQQQPQPTVDYRFFFNADYHTEFYLYTTNSNNNNNNNYNVRTTKPQHILSNNKKKKTKHEIPESGTGEKSRHSLSAPKNNTTTTSSSDTLSQTPSNERERQRVLNVVTDTISSVFGVSTRPVADSIPGIHSEQLQLYNARALRQSRFNPFQPTRILIHGWLGGSTAGLYNTLIPELLSPPNARHNIITVDWGKGAIADYITASYRVKPVGKVLAKFIDFLHQESGMRFEDLQVIGFSMGAHVAGIAGKFLQTGRLTAIYALDPALPLFRYENQEERVDLGDAEYVEVLHTSVGSYGYDRPLGHVDFYVNFGSHQPGCYLKECSHFRAFQIFSQALSREKLEGIGCAEDMWQEMLRQHKCPHETGQKLQIAPHYNHFNGTLMAKRRGVFYLLTNAQPPYRIQK